MTLPRERKRAISLLGEAAFRIFHATARARLHPKTKFVKVPVELLDNLFLALRHYPMDCEIDLFWREGDDEERDG